MEALIEGGWSKDAHDNDAGDDNDDLVASILKSNDEKDMVQSALESQTVSTVCFKNYSNAHNHLMKNPLNVIMGGFWARPGSQLSMIRDMLIF